LGFRMSFASYFGMRANRSASIYNLINYFDLTVGESPLPPSVNGPPTFVNITPDVSSVGLTDTSDVRVTATMLQVGFGPEIILQEDMDSWIRLALHPAFLFNYASASVDATTVKVDKGTGITTITSASSTGNSFLWGVGLTASAVFDLTEDWMLYGSLGYEFLPKKQMTAGELSFDVNYSGLTLGISAVCSF